MRQTSKKLRDKLGKKGLSGLPSGKRLRRQDIPDTKDWIIEGMDPVHAADAVVQHMFSLFAEGTSRLPDMKAFARIVAKTEDDYLPSGPPMSPLTHSFFSTWALCDLRFDDGDTMASCLIEASDLAGLSADQLDALTRLSASRLGIYQHAGMEGRHVRLRELVTNAEYVCHSTSGYQGRIGELWYVRLLPPLPSDSSRYHIVFTTPYILLAGREDWLRFLERSLPGLGNDATGLHSFFKLASDPN